MEKLIIATTLSGLFIKQEPWDKAHIIWYENAAKKLRDESVKKWIKEPDYFKGVDDVMKRLYPKLSDKERTIKARETFFDSVLQYIKENPEVKNKETINYFNSIKKDYRLALVTTNTKSALERILSITGLEDFFDIIETSKESEKDDKEIVFERFIKKYGKPALYIGGNKKETQNYCKRKKINSIFSENYNLEQIKRKIEKI